jgi:hypothetical protein
LQADAESSELYEDEKETQQCGIEAEEDEEVVWTVVPPGEGSCQNEIRQDNVELTVHATMLES